MCCTRLAANTGRKNDAKNRHLGTSAQLCRAISSQLRHISTIEKNLLSSSISSTCPHNMVNFSLVAAEIVYLVWGTPANLNGFRVLASLLQRRRWVEASQTLHDVWPLPGLVDYVYIFDYKLYTFSAAVARNGILPRAKFTLRPPCLALSCWQRYCTAVEQWARAKLCGVEHRAPPIFGRATITLVIGPHSSFYWVTVYTCFGRITWKPDDFWQSWALLRTPRKWYKILL